MHCKKAGAYLPALSAIPLSIRAGKSAGFKGKDGVGWNGGALKDETGWGGDIMGVSEEAACWILSPIPLGLALAQIRGDPLQSGWLIGV